MGTYSYVRVSDISQHEDRQMIAMAELGIPRENIFLDKQSGKNMARPGLQKLMAIVERGDTIVVESVSRFARNTRDLLELVEKLTAKGVEFVSQKEHIDTTTPTGKFMLTVFAAVAELERGYILQRQREGIRAAQAKGVRFGRPIAEAPANFAALVHKWERKQIDLDEALRQSGLKEATFYRRLREYRLINQKQPNSTG
jgi:DNA invertase Pin-like site-specific DNA recombinase